MADDVVMHKTLPVPVDPGRTGPTMDPKTRKRILLVWGLISLLAGFCAATQMAAGYLSYHADLGQPVWVSEDTKVRLYAPWSFVVWSIRFSDRIPRALEHGMGGFLLTGLLFGLGAFLLGKKTSTSAYAHGSARWATPSEIRAMGLVGEQGVVLGRDVGGGLLSHHGPEHIMVFAPTRSGKGVGIVVPTLLQWSSSVVVLDFKGENFELTAGFRSRFSHVLRFEPTSPKSARFNPLSEVRLRTLNEIRDAQNIAQILCDPGSAGGDSSHWVESAAEILSGVILHVLYAEDHKSLAGVNSFLKKPGETLEQKFARMETTAHLGNRPHPFIAEAARSILNKADKERSGIISSVTKALRLWTDPLIARTTDRTDFQLSDLMTGAHPTSLYLVVPPSDADRLRPLLRMLITQLIRGQLESLRKRDHRLLMMLDEFPALGRLGFMEEALAYVAGYGIKLCIIAQDTKQMESVYGPANTILSNCGVRVTFAASDIDTASRVSKMLGKATWTKRQEAESGKKGFFGLENKSRAQLEYARDLLTPDEVANLDYGWELVMVTGKPPIVTPKVRYYEDERFQTRLFPVPATWRDTARACASCLARIQEEEAARLEDQLSPDELEAIAHAALKAKEASAKTSPPGSTEDEELLQELTASPSTPPTASPSPSAPLKAQEETGPRTLARVEETEEVEDTAPDLCAPPLAGEEMGGATVSASPHTIADTEAEEGEDTPPDDPPIEQMPRASGMPDDTTDERPPAPLTVDFNMEDPFAEDIPEDVELQASPPPPHVPEPDPWVFGD